MLQFYHLSFLSFSYPFNVSSSSCLIRVKALPLVGGRGHINPELCALRDPLSTQTEPFITCLATAKKTEAKMTAEAGAEARQYGQYEEAGNSPYDLVGALRDVKTYLE